MTVGKKPVYQTSQIRAFEKHAIQNLCINGDTLMQRAGKAAFDAMQRKFPHAKRIAVFCGGGNNGGDGYVLAELAHERGLKVTVYQVGDHANLTGSAMHAYERCRDARIPIEAFSAKTDLQYPNVIVDAICGIGIKDALRDDALQAVEFIANEDAKVLAIDVPTGVDADTGAVLGKAMQADATITFIGMKLGLLTGRGSSYAGHLLFSDLQLPANVYDVAAPVAEIIHLHAFDEYLKPRMRDWHKGLSGHVLIVGGDTGFAGAVRMAGTAALRVGAGLVTIATHPENAAFLDAECPELMCHAIANAEQLQPLIAKADVIVLGPGIGQSEWAMDLWQAVLKHEHKMVVDADGLNLLAEHNQMHKDWVLTPHPGEAGRLLGVETSNIQADRLSAVKDIAKRYGGVSVLKGSGSLIEVPGELTAICDKGNPGMATAGMGDILSGVIGGLLAQGVPLGQAAELGVLMHAVAGDMAAKEGERGMIATDLLPYLRKLSNLNNG